jgi:hypothetical protein
MGYVYLSKVQLIIIAEFGAYRSEFPSVYNEALEALSNQYDYYGGGSCSLNAQLAWLFTMEGIRADALPKDVHGGGRWRNYIDDGHKAEAGYAFGKDESWFWGNVDEAGLHRYDVVALAKTDSYPGRPYFIVYR